MHRSTPAAAAVRLSRSAAALALTALLGMSIAAAARIQGGISETDALRAQLAQRTQEALAAIPPCDRA